MGKSTRKTAADPHHSLREAVTVSRFWSMVDRGASDECWPWLGDADKGYGVFFYGGKMKRAAELALSFTTGEVRHESLDTCHSCPSGDNPICVNPSHLRFDTRASNVQDMVSRGRAAAPSRKLTDEQIILMRERRALGARQKDLAEQFGVTDGQVSMIVRGKKWAHVGGPIQTERKYSK